MPLLHHVHPLQTSRSTASPRLLRGLLAPGAGGSIGGFRPARALPGGLGSLRSLARGAPAEAPAHVGRPATIGRVPDTAAPVDQQLEEIGTQLAWVRDYL